VGPWMRLPYPQGVLSFPERIYTWLLTDALNLLKVAFVALLLIKLLHWATAKMARWQESGLLNIHRDQMMRTVIAVINDVGTVSIIVMSAMMALKDVNLDVRPLLAGAGVVGLAVGFGAQSLVKDIFHGVFIVLEDQYGIGDVIKVGAVTGQVEHMTLRRTVVRDGDGTLYTIPNSNIDVLGNLTRDWSQVTLTITVGNRQKLDRVLELLRGTITDLKASDIAKANLIGDPQLLGLEKFNGGLMDILLTARTRPGVQADVAREWRRLIKLSFENAGIPWTDPQDLRLVEGGPTLQQSPQRAAA
jgi:small-conductance mechanosensitive channel